MRNASLFRSDSFRRSKLFHCCLLDPISLLHTRRTPPHPVCHSGPPGDANKTLGVHNAKEVPEGFLEEVAYSHGLEQHTAEE